MAERAARFAGGLHWRLGESRAAADTFEIGAAAASGESAAQLAALAMAVREASEHGAEPRWTGSAGAAATELVDDETWVVAEIDGTLARLRFDPMRWRSSVTPQFAARLGIRIAAREFASPVEFAGVSASSVPLAVLDTQLGDGVLGFDLLADLRWLWSPESGDLVVGTANDRDEGKEFQQALANTHWVTVRTIVDGLATQLVLVPRIGPRPEMASISPDGQATVSATAAERLPLENEPVLGQQLRLLTRVGGWRAEFDYQVVPDTGSIGQVPLAVPVALGTEFARSWTWRWSPADRQLALIEHLPEGATGR